MNCQLPICYVSECPEYWVCFMVTHVLMCLEEVKKE